MSANEVTSESVNRAFDRVEQNFIKTNRAGLTMWTRPLRFVFNRYAKAQKTKSNEAYGQLMLAEKIAGEVSDAERREKLLSLIQKAKSLLPLALIFATTCQFDFSHVRRNALAKNTRAPIARVVTGWSELGFGDFGLFYIRTKEKREVDFLVQIS